MSENTKIEWATHSFSPWIGCSKVHTGCQNCYAEAMAGRLGVTWGPNGTRRRTAESTWKRVERWNRKAAPGACTCPGGMRRKYKDHLWPCPAAPERHRVFPSLCDPFEDWKGPDGDGAMTCPKTGEPLSINASGHVWPPGWPSLSDGDDWGMRPYTMDDVRRDFFALIDRCPNLDFLLLTKRPENIRSMWRGCEDAAVNRNLLRNRPRWHRHNVWIIYSASDQSLEAGLPHLLACRDLVPVLGLSLEPLVGPVDLDACWPDGLACGDGPYVRGLDLVIVGGESGPRYRPMDLAWLESIADKCSAAGVPLFVKQDCGLKAGQQGRIPDHLWSRKEFPRVSNQP